LLVWSIPLSVTPRRGYPENIETIEARGERYHGISAAVVSVALDEKPIAAIEPVPLPGELDIRLYTALAILAATHAETGWHRSSDFGLEHGQGDNGRSWCLGQILTDDDGYTEEGYSGEQLVADRELCLRVTLARLRRSFVACPDIPDGQFVNYLSGGCSSEKAIAESARRVRLFRGMVARSVSRLGGKPPSISAELAVSDRYSQVHGSTQSPDTTP
jgi:hypothetical protein